VIGSDGYSSASVVPAVSKYPSDMVYRRFGTYATLARAVDNVCFAFVALPFDTNASSSCCSWT